MEVFVRVLFFVGDLSRGGSVSMQREKFACPWTQKWCLGHLLRLFFVVSGTTSTGLATAFLPLLWTFSCSLSRKTLMYRSVEQRGFHVVLFFVGCLPVLSA